MARTVNFRADLHLHTAFSDGTLSPGDMVRWAREAGMAVIAVTDHDVVDGLAEAAAVGKEAGVQVINGLEMTAGEEEEIHLLGYGMDPSGQALRAFLGAQLMERQGRMLAMLERLKALGIPIAKEEIIGWNSRFAGRMNLARAMVAKGYAASVREAFDRFLRPGKPAYIPRKHIETVRGVEMLRSFGAVVCLAHPGRLAMDRFSLVQRLPGWIEAGLNGLEAYHASHAEADALWFDRTARSRGLLVTGGSDCHGPSPGGSRIGDHLDRWRTVREDVRDLIGQIEQGTAKIQ